MQKYKKYARSGIFLSLFLIYINISHFLPFTLGNLFSQFTKKDNPLPNAGSDFS